MNPEAPLFFYAGICNLCFRFIREGGRGFAVWIMREVLILFYFFAGSGGAAAVGKFERALLVLRIISLDIYFLCDIFYFF